MPKDLVLMHRAAAFDDADCLPLEFPIYGLVSDAVRS
jgi:hypothetical protein